VTDKEVGDEQTRQILIVDDDAMGSRLLVTLLEVEGYSACQVEDWENPLGDVEKRRPSLVIVDVHLRHRSGFDLLSQIRAHSDPDVASSPVLMMSAEDYRLESRRAGADGFLLKPFDLPTLSEAIRNIKEDSLSKAD
jgi:two-component system cell cycle response regulator DivK